MSLSQRLNRRVTLKIQTATQDGTGEVQPTAWSNFIAAGDGAIWAEVKDISGREFIAAGSEQNSTQTKVTIRYREGVQPSMRLIYSGRVYQIDAVLGEDRKTIALMCSKVGNVQT